MNDYLIILEMFIKYIVVMVLMMLFTGGIMLVINTVIGAVL